MSTGFGPLPLVRPAVGQTVKLSGLGWATPPFRVSQEDVLRFILHHFPLRASTKNLYRKTLSNRSIQWRHLGVEHLSELLDNDLDRIAKRYERWAVELSRQSLQKALDSAQIDPQDVDCIIVTSCTGSLCPGLSTYLIDENHLRHDVRAMDLAGMGCGAALPALEQAKNFLLAHPQSTAAVVATEICSAAFLSNDAPDIVVSNTIFGDGSAAALMKASNEIVPSSRSGQPPDPRISGFASLTRPGKREILRFRRERGRLRNVLDKTVPDHAAEAIGQLTKTFLASKNILPEQIQRWILHPGGEKVLQRIARELSIPPEKIQSARAILRSFGNMSSPSVLFVLAHEISRRAPSPGERGVMTSFGAGLSAHAALLEF